MNGLRVFACCAALTAASVTALSAASPDAAKGKAIFKQCATCHNAGSDAKKIGPSLKGLFKREKLANGKRVGDATVRAKIDEGGNGMPQYKDMLSEQEKADLIAYLKTL
jgi:cytochrome c